MARSSVYDARAAGGPRRAGWLGLATRLAGAFWLRTALALVAAYVALVPVGIVVAAQPGQAAHRAQRLERVVGDLAAIQAGALGAGGGLRGYVETGDAGLLDEFDAGRAETDAAWSALERDATGTSLAAGLPRLRATTGAWQSWAARRRLERVPTAPGAGLGDGETLLGRLETEAAALAERASALASRAGAEARRLAALGAVAGTIGPTGGSAALVALGSALLWLALGPVRRLARAANRLAGGLEPEIPYAGRRDAVGAIAGALVRGRGAMATRRIIWQHSPVAMLVFGADLVLRQVNPAELVMFRADPVRFTDREYMATIVSTVTHPDDLKATARMYRRLFSGQSETERLEKRYVRHDGSVFWGNCTLTLIRDDAGTPDQFVCIIEDVSQRRERLERAARVQSDLLPSRPPALDGYELAGFCRPSPEMGGDFYDWQRREPGILTLTLGDVMGRGMPAALLMAMVRIALRIGAAQGTAEEAVGSLVAATGRHLDRAGAFVRLFHAAVDLRTGQLTYVDAGHGLAVVVGEHDARPLAGVRSLPVGVMEGETYAESSLRLAPGETLVVFSDEVLDVHPGLEGRLAGVHDLLAGAGSAQEMAERLASGPGAPDDDVTAVVLRRLG
jgi:PAS domain S-box-containing protein